MPFSIIGSTEDVTTVDGRTVKGREYLWGVAEGTSVICRPPRPNMHGLSDPSVENEDHCDFRKLRSLLIRTYMLDLISTTEEIHYENYRQGQMETRKPGEMKPRKFENPKFKEEEEMLRKRFTEQVKVRVLQRWPSLVIAADTYRSCAQLEEARFRQWEAHLIAERDRLNRDLEQAHSVSASSSAAPSVHLAHSVSACRTSSSSRPSWTLPAATAR